MLEYIITELFKALEEDSSEALAKAKDRIKAGIRTDKGKANSKDIYDALTNLIADPKISASARRHFLRAQKEYKEKATKEDVQRQAENPRVQAFEPGAAAQQQAAQDQARNTEIAQHLDQNAPTKVKELGHAEQYKQDTENPKMRSKSAEKITAGVRNRLATGEGLTIRDKQYGANLDAQAKLKAAEQKLVEQKGPQAVIRVPASPPPAIPEEHANHPAIKAMMNLRSQHTDPEKHKIIDAEINNHLAKLSGSNPMSKSIDVEFGHSKNGQWFIKAF